MEEGRRIPMRNLQRQVHAHAICDDRDYYAMKDYRWSFHVGNACARIDGKPWLMHRYVMKRAGLLDTHKFIIHINGNALDNRLSNLRLRPREYESQQLWRIVNYNYKDGYVSF